MPKRKVEYHRLADKDSEENFRWYLKRSAWAAEGYLESIKETAERIAESAESFPVEFHGVRWVKLKKYPFAVYFMIIDDRTCRIYSVAHDRRRPGFWLRRLTRP